MEMINIDFLFILFEKYMLFFMFFIPFIAQMGIPIGGMFFVLFAASISETHSTLFFLWGVVFLGTVSADITNYHIGKFLYNTRFVRNLLRKKTIKNLYHKSHLFIQKRGEISIFLTRFLATGIGPYISYVLGLQKYNFRKFATWVIAGEFLYALELVLLGHFFKEAITEIVTLFRDFTLIFVIGFVLALIIRKIFRRL